MPSGAMEELLPVGPWQDQPQDPVVSPSPWLLSSSGAWQLCVWRLIQELTPGYSVQLSLPSPSAGLSWSAPCLALPEDRSSASGRGVPSWTPSLPAAGPVLGTPGLPGDEVFGGRGICGLEPCGPDGGTSQPPCHHWTTGHLALHPPWRLGLFSS